MIKIEKDLTSIPQSLIPAFPEFFPELPRIPRLAINTHAKRMEIISAGNYIDNDKYNSLYKREDIKRELESIYHGKCAFCEMKVEQYHVEHYRPKTIYYWLAFSWDNLLMACSTCNVNKGTNFELEGVQVTFDNSEENIRNINSSSANYDFAELPKMVNPEVTDPADHITFHRDGLIESNEPRFKYTIETCKIDRKWLNDERKHLLEVYERDIRSALVENSNPNEQKIEIASIVRKFVNDSKDLRQTFLAFRRFSILSGWLADIVREVKVN